MDRAKDIIKTYNIWKDTGFKDKDMSRMFDRECNKQNTIALIERIAALEAKAEPVAFRGTGPDGDNGVTDSDVVLEAWEEAGFAIEPLYTAPPSTAEVRAQALEDYARKLDEADAISRFQSEMVDLIMAEAKRIREEG